VAKRDFLPHNDYLSDWVLRNKNSNQYLVDFFRKQSLPYNLESSHRVAKWAYSYAESTNYEMWHREYPLSPVNNQWRDIFGIRNGQDSPKDGNYAAELRK